MINEKVGNQKVIHFFSILSSDLKLMIDDEHSLIIGNFKIMVEQGKFGSPDGHVPEIEPLIGQKIINLHDAQATAVHEESIIDAVTIKGVFQK
jgi:hypothetical protein